MISIILRYEIAVLVVALSLLLTLSSSVDQIDVLPTDKTRILVRVTRRGLSANKPTPVFAWDTNTSAIDDELSLQPQLEKRDKYRKFGKNVFCFCELRNYPAILAIRSSYLSESVGISS